MDKKESNPKDIIGVRKIPMHVLSMPVMAEMSLGMGDGGMKYGTHNYRVAGVRASVYFDATMRHLMAWWEGEDIDPDSGISHVSKAMSSLHVLRDAMMNEMWEDDRPPKFKNKEWVKEMNTQMGEIIEKHKTCVPPFTEKTHGKK